MKLTPEQLSAMRAQAYPDILNDDGVEWKIARIGELEKEVTRLQEALNYTLNYGPECAVDNPLHARQRDKAIALLKPKEDL